MFINCLDPTKLIQYKGKSFTLYDYFLRIRKNSGEVFEKDNSTLCYETYYYLNQLNFNGADRFFNGWNWAAFFAASYWLAYRQVFWLNFIFGLILFLPPAVIIFIIPVAYSAVYGLAGNYLYLRKISHDLMSNAPPKIENTSFPKSLVVLLLLIPQMIISLIVYGLIISLYLYITSDNPQADFNFDHVRAVFIKLNSFYN